MSLEAFLADPRQLEIIDGEIKEKVMATTAEHGEASKLFFLALHTYGVQHNGDAYVEATFIMPDADESKWVKGSRIPDVLYYADGRLAAYKAGNPHWRDRPFALVPDLVVEVISSTDLALEVERKVEKYLADGVRLIWLVYPDLGRVTVYRAGAAQAQIVRAGETLDGGEVLPGFALALAELFA
jgi:Uma2 family endonuclease